MAYSRCFLIGFNSYSLLFVTVCSVSTVHRYLNRTEPNKHCGTFNSHFYTYYNDKLAALHYISLWCILHRHRHRHHISHDLDGWTRWRRIAKNNSYYYWFRCISSIYFVMVFVYFSFLLIQTEHVMFYC